MRRIVICLITVLCFTNASAKSTCYGTTANGRIDNACRLPASGDNFSSYSRVLSLAGRTYVHCTVKDVFVDAFSLLSESHPDSVFVYGETGLKQGGLFKPHKTHQNGLSVDVMIPVTNKHGKSVALPTSVFNKYGYDIDFSLAGKYKDLSIDYEAFSALLAALKTSAQKHKIKIWRVIFDPKMQKNLHNTNSWSSIAAIEFSKRRSWVRHDDHFHIDFSIPCEPM